MRDRRERMPYIDSLTGVAQRGSSTRRHVDVTHAYRQTHVEESVGTATWCLAMPGV